ncbi:endonuclease/exonuclease/phosphatase family protein [Sphingomonas sp.]|uniref:endonuclease/exonuclease/phosphatase family protein n=1 Tax=Sphingomonas sp. TaxID=28214 RepID=UPI003D6D9769
MKLGSGLKRLAITVAMLGGASGANQGAAVRAVPAEAAFAAVTPWDGTLSVLTYNVKGLPWPIASDRPADLAEIGRRLHEMRRRGTGPQVVVLQEAFTDEARAIGLSAGYRHIVSGPAAGEASDAAMTEADRRFAGDARWWLGETFGSFVSSGLQVLSDHPVIRVRRLVYPRFACAGSDCLANKGALLVTLRLPDGSLVDVLTTHLNSRHSSGAPDARSLQAYRRQAEFLSAFINQWHDPAVPLVAAGDYNVGTAPARGQALIAQVAGWRGAAKFRDALRQVAGRQTERGTPIPASVSAVMHHNADWTLFAPGTNAPLCPVAIRIPFGPDAKGRALSDHIGFTAVFRLAGARC